MGIPSGRPARIALGLSGAIVVLLLVAQLVLPAIAARIAREQIGKYGTVRSVSVKAFPAVELLWGHAESARIETGQLDMSVSQFDGLLPRMRGIERIDMNASGLQLGSVRMSDVSTVKRGGELDVRASLTQADLQSALPAGAFGPH